MPAFLWKNWSLSVKIAAAGAMTVLFSTLLLISLAGLLSEEYHKLAQREVDGLIATDLDHITEGVFNLVSTENEAVLQQLEQNLAIARHLLFARGRIKLRNDLSSWVVRNQFTGSSMTVELPLMIAGETVIPQKLNSEDASGIVDEISNTLGETVTVFQRLNAAGDMVRIATTVLDSQGKKALGTYIPVRNPDGTANPVLSQILSGHKFVGRAYVVNTWYLTAYDPLVDESGNLIGMLYVGVKQKNVEDRVRQAIVKTRVGKTGYVYVIGGKGAERGCYIISQGNERDGENIWDSKDSNGNMVIQSIINHALALKPGEFHTERYPWQNPGESVPRMKIARLAYFAPWDWVIGTSVYEDELNNYHRVLSLGRKRMHDTMLFVGILTAFLAVLGGFYLARSIARPIKEITEIADSITQGNLEALAPVQSADETGVLARTFNHMTQKIRHLISETRQSEVKYRTLFEGALEGVFLTNLNGEFISINPSMARILGYDSPEEIMKAITDVHSQLYVNPAHYREFLATLIERGEVLRKELQVFKKDRQKICLFVGGRLVNFADGSPSHIQAFALDITELQRAEENRLKLEQQLYQAQKMETVGQLAGGIAHDFNNLLTPILGYSEILLDEIPADGKHHKFVSHIVEAADRAKVLTRQLLAFGRKQLLELKQIDLAKIIHGFERILRRTIRENIKIVVRSVASEALIKADSNQMEQVLMNLSINAQDSMPCGGLLDISVDTIFVDEIYAAGHSAVKPGPYVVLTVSDTGTGIDKETQKRIFEPFFTTKEVGKGSGLGLSTVFGIVKQHGGHILLYSEDGKGSTFKVLLPQDTQANAENSRHAEEALQPPPLLYGNETVLVVEDETLVRDLVSQMLEKLGYKVMSASNPEECFSIMAEHHSYINLVLSDVIMPGMDGKEMASRLHEHYPSLKMLFMSGYATNVFACNGLTMEGAHLLEKPICLHNLASRIRQVLDEA
ncbi:MAG: Cache 3/Cache 2 fusion domain-containing protein [Candidatus Riflebacteria bacterium]|nr:Cache 3/Cache 2 fusion domain-containing protein [Candidatus Riflebacteria bacterium]